MNREEKSRKANDLRKAGDLEEAKDLYSELWAEEKDKFIAAGLLHCYRKLGEFEKSFDIIDDIITDYSDFNWTKNECIWTLIQGKLYKLPDDIDTFTTIQVAESIIILKPDFLALKTAVFKVLKTAKKNRDWEIILDWIDKINPDELEEQSELKKDWSDQELWYYYKVCTLAKIGEFQAAIDLASSVEDRFTSKRKFFEREKARSEISQENFEEGEKIYTELVRGNNSEWWLLHEYGKILLKNGKLEEAFKLFCKAALTRGPLTHKVKLLRDIGDHYLMIEKPVEALYHFKLIKNIRENEGWGVPDSLIEAIDNLESYDDESTDSGITKELLKKCKEYWKNSLPKKDLPSNTTKRKKLRGKVKLGDQEKPFCFITTKSNESYFCFKSDLPDGLRENQIIEFDIKKSYDKKKGKESWRAFNIHYVYSDKSKMVLRLFW